MTLETYKRKYKQIKGRYDYKVASLHKKLVTPSLMDTWLNERKSELQPRLRVNKSNHLIGILTMLNNYSFLAKKS